MSQEPVAATLQDANEFEIAGPIVISYSSTSITGTPLLSYKDAERDVRFSGDEITRSGTPVGELVTITLENVPDAFVRTFTLVVPRVRLQTGDQTGDPPAFDTVGVETTDRSGAFVPPPGPTGVLQTYRVHQLRGVARFLVP